MKADNLEWYRAFYVTARLGSLSRAAEELYITQPAISYIIKQLEGRLDARLFFRTARGVKLTAEGEALYQYIEQALHFVDSGEKQLEMIKSLGVGEVAIGASDMLCKHFLLPYLEVFHQQYPDIKIKVTNRTSLESIELLKQGKVDFAVVHLPLEEQKHLTIRESRSLQDCFVVGEKYRSLADNGPVKLEQLLNYPVLLLEHGSNTRRYVDRFAASQGVELVPEIELGSLDLLVQFARIGLGAAYVVRDFIAPELQSGMLFEVSLHDPIPPRKIGIVTLTNVPLSAAGRHFVRMLQGEEDKTME